jgi:hypothetical protein
VRTERRERISPEKFWKLEINIQSMTQVSTKVAVVVIMKRLYEA